MGLRPGSTTTDREVLVRGRRAFEHGEDETALDALSRLTAKGCEYADVHYMVGMLQERTGDLDAALESLRHAVRVNPAYIEALLALASLHERRGNFDRSQSYAERASQLSQPTAGGLDPTTRGKLANQQAELADALAAAGERQEAIEEYRRALDRCPTFHDIRYRLGMTLRESGLPFQAAREFRRILRAHPGMLESQIQLGLTYYSMGRTPDAVQQWEAVLERDPSRDEARMYLRLVRGGESTPAVDVGAAVAGWTTAPLPGTAAPAESSASTESSVSADSSASASSEKSEPDFERDLGPAPAAAFADFFEGALEE